MTTVINIKDAPEGWHEDKKYAYIGRAGNGESGYFGNPFPLKPNESREVVLEKFKSYFYDRVMHDAEFYYHINQLYGKVLVCFCKPLLCHGDIIVEFVDEEYK